MFRLIVTTDSGRTVTEYATADAAWAARDRALDAGFNRVRIEGLPETVWASGGCFDSEIIEIVGE